jgi:hypothetical protein
MPKSTSPAANSMIDVADPTTSMPAANNAAPAAKTDEAVRDASFVASNHPARTMTAPAAVPRVPTVPAPTPSWFRANRGKVVWPAFWADLNNAAVANSPIGVQAGGQARKMRTRLSVVLEEMDPPVGVC